MTQHAVNMIFLACAVALALVMLALVLMPLWDAIRKWVTLSWIEKLLAAAAVVGLVLYGGSKQRGETAAPNETNRGETAATNETNRVETAATNSNDRVETAAPLPPNP